ncbi:MAG: alpha/beta hydrolase [Alphaproteobacteria bacterium]
MERKQFFHKRAIEGQPPATIAIRQVRFNTAPGRPGILFCGGFHSDMTGSKASRLDDHLTDRQTNFTRFDYSGHGSSGGRFEDGTIGYWYDDCLAVFDTVTGGPQIVVGSSMGGWMAMLLARDRPERISGLILMAPAPDFPSDLIEPSLSPEHRHDLERRGQCDIASEYGDSAYPITRRFLDESRDHNLLGGAPIPVRGPVRILHGDADPDVPLSHGFLAASVLQSEDLVVEVIKGGDHRLSTERDLSHLCRRVDEMTDMVVNRPER